MPKCLKAIDQPTVLKIDKIFDIAFIFWDLINRFPKYDMLND